MGLQPTTTPAATDVTGSSSDLRQLSTAEGQPSGEATPPSADEKLSSKFALFARREKALLKRAQDLKAKEEALKAKETSLTGGDYIAKSQIAERAKTDPLGWMDEVGLTTDEFTQALLNADPNSAMLRKFEQRFKDMEKKQEETNSRIEKQQTQAFDQAIGVVRNEVKLLIDGSEEFEAIRETGSEEAVVELIKETCLRDGTLMSTAEAAREVETYILERAEKMARLKKIQARLTPQEQAQAQQTQPKQQQQPQQTIKTLTNAATASTSKALSAREKRERAILAFKGQLTN